MITKKLIIIAIVLQLSYVCLALLRDWSANIPLFLAIFFFSFLLYGFSVWDLFQNRYESISAWMLLIPAVLFRLTFLATEPSLSEDFYRYVWDGRVQMAGHSPYVFPPNAPQLEHLRDHYYERINHKQFRTPYSAAAEMFYKLFALISAKVWAFKAFLLLFDFLLLEILRRLLRKEGRSVAWLLIYAWHPLPILEFAGSGHMDIIGIAFLFFSYLLVRSQKFALGGGAFAISVLTKYLPILSLPWLLRERTEGSHQRGSQWKFILAAGITGTLLLLQYYSPDWNMFSGALSYYKKWRFNDSLFGILYKALGGAEPARITGMIVTVLAMVVCLVRKFSFYRAVFVAFGCVLLFSPVVHPWYLCWVLPLLVFHPNKPWIFFCGWIVLAYFIRYLFPAGVWKPVLWLKLLVYVPLYAWLLIDLARSVRSKPNVAQIPA